jgi:hypothetical protein
MTGRHIPEPAERAELTEADLAIATLVGRYVERREHQSSPKDGSRGRLRIDYGNPREPQAAIAWLWKFIVCRVPSYAEGPSRSLQRARDSSTSSA